MYTLLKPIIESRLRRNIIMSVEETVQKVLMAADAQLFKMRNMAPGGQSGVFGQQQQQQIGQQGSVYGGQRDVPGSSSWSNVSIGGVSGTSGINEDVSRSQFPVSGGSQLDPKGPSGLGPSKVEPGNAFGSSVNTQPQGITTGVGNMGINTSGVSGTTGTGFGGTGTGFGGTGLGQTSDQTTGNVSRSRF